MSFYENKALVHVSRFFFSAFSKRLTPHESDSFTFLSSELHFARVGDLIPSYLF